MMQDFRGGRIALSGFHAPARDRIEELQDAVLTIDAAGMIVDIDPHGDVATARRLPEHWTLLPGFCDLHVHAPQYAQLGTALDVPLEDWLQRYTFPLEAQFDDLDFARDVYSTLVADLLAVGTTTALHFATIHVPATKLLADLCKAAGHRALIGKVAMDDPDQCPPYYRDASAHDAVEGTRAVIDYITALDAGVGMVHPVITPRFIPTCTDECLTGLGALAAETGARVQSHVSESDWQHGFVQNRCGCSDTQAFDRFGLLRAGTVLAHGTHLSPTDMDLMVERLSGVAHCPLSNAYFAGAIFPLRAALEKGLSVGLGSDISGGPLGSIWETARMAIAAARIRESGTDATTPPSDRGTPDSRIDYRTAFFLATRGGGQTLGLPVGSFEKGMKFDAMAIDPHAAQGTLRLWPGQTGELKLERLLYGVSRANIAAVWTDGQRRV